VTVEVLRHANVVVLLGMALSAAPMVMGMLFAVRPDEARLALMRPLSLAGIFVSLSNMMLGVMNALLVIGRVEAIDLDTLRIAAVGLSESTVPPFVGFSFLTVGWLCVALGMRKHA
jgi:hypothetical protein